MKSIVLGLALLFTAGAAFSQQTPAAAPAAAAKAPQSPRVTASGENVEIAYGQPSKRGRQIFPGLLPFGEIWRTGANKSTDITFKKDATFGGKKVKAGTYALFTIPGEKEFTVILNSVTNQPGSADYEKNKDKNVVEVKAPRQKTAATVEKLTFSFPKGAMVFEWDDTRVSVPLKF
ncbi:DUF2911 domain-containing protein [Chitinophaga lutea]